MPSVASQSIPHWEIAFLWCWDFPLKTMTPVTALLHSSGHLHLKLLISVFSVFFFRWFYTSVSHSRVIMIEMNILQRQRSFSCLLEASDNSFWVSNKMLTVRVGMSLTLTCSWDSTPPIRLSCTTSVWGLFLTLFYPDLSCLAVIFWVPALFWKENAGEVVLVEREGAGDLQE